MGGTGTHYRQAHTRNGRPVRGGRVHHQLGEKKEKVADAPRRKAPTVKAGMHAVALSGTLAATWTIAAGFSVVTKLMMGVTAWALGEVGVKAAAKHRKSRAKRRPRATSARRKRALRVHRAKQTGKAAWVASRATGRATKATARWTKNTGAPVAWKASKATGRATGKASVWTARKAGQGYRAVAGNSPTGGPAAEAAPSPKRVASPPGRSSGARGNGPRYTSSRSPMSTLSSWADFHDRAKKMGKGRRS